MSTQNDGVNETHTENEGEEQEVETLSSEEIAELKAKAQKAEELEADVGRLKRDLKKATKEDKETPKNNQPPEEKTNEPDYARLAYLKAEGVTHPDDQKIIQDEANRLKLPLTDVLQMEHIKAKLKDNADQREAQDGMPEGKNRKGAINRGEVDYYLSNPDEQVPTDNVELANKVIEAKMAKERNALQFSDQLYVE